jgi:hypothetical protein
MPASRIRSSAPNCVVVPMPALAKVTFPGFALAKLTRSASLLKRLPVAVTRTKGAVTARTTGIKSFSGSYDTLSAM